jgi:hypothetical protein
MSLVKRMDNIYEGSLFINAPATIQYKYPRGTWNSEALNKHLQIPENSILKVTNDTNILDTIKYCKDIVYECKNILRTIDGCLGSDHRVGGLYG